MFQIQKQTSFKLLYIKNNFLLIFIFKICAHLVNLVYTFKETVPRNTDSLKVDTLPQMFYNSVRDFKCSKIVCHIDNRWFFTVYSAQESNGWLLI